MYKGKFEAPKGAPRPKRAAATRRIEDVPLSSAQTAPVVTPKPDVQAAPVAAPKPDVQAAPVAAPQSAPAAAPQEDFLNSLQGISQSTPQPQEESVPAAVSGSDKLVPMETLSLRRAGVTDAARQAVPAKAGAAKASTGKKKKKSPSKGTIAFYSIYGVALLLVFALLAGVLSYLDGWLSDYERSQPKVKSQETFNQLFAQPDWGQLYDMAGFADTTYEGKEEYVQYMTEKVGSQELRFVATASGDPSKLSKYIVKMGDERIGTFTLEAHNSGTIGIKQWDLCQVTLMPVQRQQSVTVSVGAGQTPYINGVALEDQHIISSTVTLAEEYLPEGVYGYSYTTYRVDGLLMKPTVEAKDAQGNPVALSFDDTLNRYYTESAKPSFTISDRDRETVIAAAKVLSEFRIERKDQTALARHFDKNSDYYKATVGQDTWMQTAMYKSHKFSDPVVSEYFMYSDDLFSAHVEMTLYVTRTDGSVKEWDASSTFFFTKRSDGTWIVTDANKIRLQEEVTKVRLMYMLDGETVTYELVDSTSVQLEPPYVEVPEGKVFAGWYRETMDESGNTTLSLAFQPDPTTGLVYLGTGVELEPMVLHARFEDKGAE